MEVKMAKKEEKKHLINSVKERAASINVDSLKQAAAQTGGVLSEKAAQIKDAAVATKDEIEEKLTELDRMLEESINEYNGVFTQMNDKGIRLYVERSRAVDVIDNVEQLINSIANHPKSLDKEFDEITVNKQHFIEGCEFAEKELAAAREAAGGAGAGLAAGAAVMSMGPTAAMWVATTFGTASTGTAISALSGTAATNAALAWLGGGALSAGGGGIAAGNALLAMAGPIGWSIAGASLLSSILLLSRKRTKINKQKNEEIEAIKKNTEAVKEMDAQLEELLNETTSLMMGVKQAFFECAKMFDGDYSQFTEEQKMKLGALLNNTKAMSVLFDRKLG